MRDGKLELGMDIETCLRMLSDSSVGSGGAGWQIGTRDEIEEMFEELRKWASEVEMSLSLIHSPVPIVQNICPRAVVATAVMAPLVCGHFPMQPRAYDEYIILGHRPWSEYIEYMGAREGSPSAFGQ